LLYKKIKNEGKKKINLYTHPTMPCALKNNKGFSLIEMVIVLVIASFIMAMITPSLFKSLAGLEQRTSINKLVTTLRYARSQAVTLKQAYQVYLDLNEYSYWLAPVESSDSASSSTRAKEIEVPATAIPLEAQLKIEKVLRGPKKEITSGVATIVFYPRGDSSGGEIILRDGDNVLHTIVVDPITGRVKLKK
jgi:general secretion pathway protein H